MTVLQFVVNVVLVVVADLVVEWLFGRAGLNVWLAEAVSIAVIVLVVVTNPAARMGVR